ncbi:MAG: type III secretion system export apparatus subunit SctV [Chromatiales bacterium]|nr:type III secretion system export apparatus subunit SctV [Chromatiales bacterium]
MIDKDNIQRILIKITSRNDVLLALMLVFIIFMMVLPLPTTLIDILIGTNMSMSVILLMLAIYISSPLEFSAFPSVLLLTTLFRLALSISTTRLILLQADAGQIIFTFGNFVVAGNLVVGMVIFLIITIVQFMVITKGAERVAEVSARFSLDAMPGKQMSIDGDMRAGVIDVEQARYRRSLVEKESQLYGSMDGAMKFVKGDAIAGLIIIVVNLIGGLTIGIVQRNMDVAEAMHVYSTLTIGDGLITQIPALLIALTAGIIVTRVTTDSGSDPSANADLASDISGQIGAQPRALLVASGLMLVFGIIPGFPTPVFVLLSIVTGGGGIYLLYSAKKKEAMKSEDNLSASLPFNASPGESAPTSGKLTEQEEFTLSVPLLIDIEASVQEHLDTKTLNDELFKVRRALYLDLGVPFPGIYLRFNANISNVGDYSILMQEVPVAHGNLKYGCVLYNDNKEQMEILNIPFDTDQPFLPAQEALWVADDYKEQLNKAGLSYMELPKILTFHLSYVLKRYSEDFIGIQEARYLLQQMEINFSELTKEVQRILPIHTIAEVLQRLVSEDISIRNMRLILEALVEWGQKEKDTVLLTEYVRGSLKRYVSYKFSSGQNTLPAYLLDQDLEETIRKGIRQTSAGNYLALDPTVTRNFVERVKQTVGTDIARRTNKPVLVTAMDIRRYVRKMLEVELYELAVLSYQELTQEITVQPLSRIGL